MTNRCEGSDLDLLLDFLIGFSVAEIATRRALEPAVVEASMRDAFAHYGFVARAVDEARPRRYAR